MPFPVISEYPPQRTLAPGVALEESLGRPAGGASARACVDIGAHERPVAGRLQPT